MCHMCSRVYYVSVESNECRDRVPTLLSRSAFAISVGNKMCEQCCESIIDFGDTEHRSNDDLAN